jgi:HEAT repeat protein
VKSRPEPGAADHPRESPRATLLTKLDRFEERAAALVELAARPLAERSALIDGEVAAALIGLLASERRSEQRCAAEAIARLVADHAAVSAALRAALVAPTQRTRWGAAFALARSPLPLDPALWPAVREAMALDDGDQRWAAAELAARLAKAHPQVLDDLRRTLGDSAATLRKMALYCLREVGPPDLAPLALSRLDDPEPSVRLAALAALVHVPGGTTERRDSALAVARRLDADRDPGVRRAAAATLGNLGIASDEVTAALRRAVGDSDASLARAARGALAKLAAPAERVS